MALLMVAFIAVAMVAFYGYIPWAWRHVSLYLLHALRDQLYELGDSPETRDTALYRDFEFLMCLAINRTRERDLKTTAQMVRSLFGRSDGSSDDRYEDSERVLGGTRVKALLGLWLPFTGVLLLYQASQRPQIVVALLVVLPFVLAQLLLMAASGGLKPFAGISRAVLDTGGRDASFSLDGAQPG